jgi:preprotein translocase subunit SecE
VEWNPAIWIRDGRQYLIDVRSEFRKLTWPTQREYVGGTIGVIVIVAIIASALGLIDVALAAVMQWILP